MSLAARRFAVAAVLALAFAATLAAQPPAGFRDDLLATVPNPVALAFMPDGSVLVAIRDGTLRVIEDGVLLPTPALTFGATEICTNGGRGLLGVAVDPDFTTSRFIYLFYTHNKFANDCPESGDETPVHRVSRFTLPPGNVIDPASEVMLLDNLPSVTGGHAGGDLEFDNDGLLYITVGDDNIPSNARQEHRLLGKVLRIARDGSIPATNPVQGAGTARCNTTGETTPGNRCQETFAWGLRNPFRLAMDLDAPGARFFINDTGQAAWEEIDLGQAGADYGWNCREGAHTHSTTGACSPTPPGMVDPIFEYAHGVPIPGTSAPAECQCVSGGAFVPDGLWPGFDGAYLFGDCTCGRIFRLDDSGGAFSAADFAVGAGVGIVHLAFGPYGNSQALYYTIYEDGGDGQVRRITRLPGPLAFHSLAPCRVADTRSPKGPSGGPALQGGATREFPVTGICDVPTTARAVAVNVSAISPSAAGHLTAFAAGTTAPATAVLNFGPHQIRSGHAIVELGAAGDLAISCSMPGVPGGGATHIVLDVAGWFE